MLGYDKELIKKDMYDKEIKELVEENNKIIDRLRGELSYQGYDELVRLLNNKERLMDLYMEGCYVYGYISGVGKRENRN